MRRKRLAIVEVTYELLAQLLRVPKDHRIYRVFADDTGKYYNRQSFFVTLEGPSLQHVNEGEQIPYRIAEITEEGLKLE